MVVLSQAQTLIIPEGITTIGNLAFSNCSNLEQVILPKSLETINDSAFSRTGLKTISFPENVQHIGELAFYNCKNLTSVYFEGNELEETVYGFHSFYTEGNCTFYFKDAYSAENFKEDLYYDPQYGVKSTNYNW